MISCFLAPHGLVFPPPYVLMMYVPSSYPSWDRVLGRILELKPMAVRPTMAFATTRYTVVECFLVPDTWLNPFNESAPCQARNFLQQMKLGDGVLYYHSSCKKPGVYGICEVRACDWLQISSPVASLT